MKKAKRSGAGLADIERFQRQLESLSFLSWLNPYMKLRNDTRCNIKNNTDNSRSGEDADGKDEDMSAISDISDAESPNIIDRPKNKRKFNSNVNLDLNDSQTASSSTVENKSLYLARGKEKKLKKDTSIHDESADVLRTINKRLQEKSAIPI